VAITKEVIGYGTTSSREVGLSLFNTQNRKTDWSGQAKVNFDWFISDGNYRNVAQKINDLIIKELKKKAIIRA